MRYLIFVSGLAILAMGISAMFVLDKINGQGFLSGALQLGGGILICGIFSIKMQWHGYVGAGILALLGAARGIGNVPGLVKFLAGDRPRGVTPLFETGVTLVCVVLLLRVIRVLKEERLRQMLAEE